MPGKPFTRIQTIAAFWAKVDQSGGPDACWPWTGFCDEHGYGRFNFQGLVCQASRVSAYIDGMVKRPRAPRNQRGAGFVLHTCDNPPCCNPKHLEVGTKRKNTRDAVKRGRFANCQRPKHAKLTDRQAQEIRARHEGGERTGVLALEFRLSRRSIQLLVSGRTYRKAA